MIVRRAINERVGVLEGYGALVPATVLGLSDWVLYGGLGILAAGVAAMLLEKRGPR